MNTSNFARRSERGMVLVSALLLLLVVTIMAIAMFRNYGIQERIAGNIREKQRALHSAETAEQYAEYWLTQSNNAAMAPIPCDQILNANLQEGQICANVLSQLAANGGAVGGVTTVPWTTGGADGALVGTTYTPAGMAPNLTTGGGAGTYYQPPQYYISDLGTYAGGPGEVFQIDAVGYGTAANAVAVIESTFLVGPEVVNLGGL